MLKSHCPLKNLVMADNDRIALFFSLGCNGGHGRDRSDGEPGFAGHGRLGPADVSKHDSH